MVRVIGVFDWRKAMLKSWETMPLASLVVAVAPLCVNCKSKITPPSAAEAKPQSQPAPALIRPVTLKTTETSYGRPVRADAFSPDMRHAAYLTGYGGKLIVVVDGVKGKKYDGLASGNMPGSLVVFSPDSKHVAYVAIRNQKSVLVVDGVEGKEYDHIYLGKTIFSPDSKIVPFMATRDGKRMFVVDGKEQNDTKGKWLLLSTDFNRFPYVREWDGQWIVIFEDASSKEYDGFNGRLPDERYLPYQGSQNIVFSPDTKRYAYVAGRFTKEVKRAIEAAGGLGELKRFSDIYRLNERDLHWFAVIDGAEGKEYDEVDKPVFSPDSKHVMYTAKSGQKRIVVVDIREGNGYDAIVGAVFSPDSKHFAYKAKRGDKWVAVLDGVEGKEMTMSQAPPSAPIRSILHTSPRGASRPSWSSMASKERNTSGFPGGRGGMR